MPEVTFLCTGIGGKERVDSVYSLHQPCVSCKISEDSQGFSEGDLIDVILLKIDYASVWTDEITLGGEDGLSPAVVSAASGKIVVSHHDDVILVVPLLLVQPERKHSILILSEICFPHCILLFHGKRLRSAAFSIML